MCSISSHYVGREILVRKNRLAVSVSVVDHLILLIRCTSKLKQNTSVCVLDHLILLIGCIRPGVKTDCVRKSSRSSHSVDGI